MIFYAMLKRRGKKTPKRWGNKRLLLHGVGFRWRKWVKLPEKFLNDTGLIDPDIRPAIISSLSQNYGLCIRSYADDKKAPDKVVDETETTTDETETVTEETGGE